MKKTIISHDTKAALARIKFEHNDVVHEADYNLKMIVPGTEYVFDQMGVDFTKAHQLKAIDKLEATIQLQIEQGIITNPPIEENHDYTPPPTAVEESVDKK
jgi:hypothetical protein